MCRIHSTVEKTLPMWSFLVTIFGSWRGAVYIHVNSCVEGTFMCGLSGGYIHMERGHSCV